MVSDSPHSFHWILKKNKKRGIDEKKERKYNLMHNQEDLKPLANIELNHGEKKND